MTPLYLQDALVEEMRALLGPTFRVCAQNTPRRKAEGDESIFPYCRVYLGDGEDGDETWQDVVLVVCTRDTSEDLQGYRDAMNAIQRIRERIKKQPVLAGRFTADTTLRWTYPDCDENWPLYLGAVLFRVQLPQIEPDSNYT